MSEQAEVLAKAAGEKIHRSKIPRVAGLLLTASLLTLLGGRDEHAVSPIGISVIPGGVSEFSDAAEHVVIPTQVPKDIIASYQNIQDLPVSPATLFQQAVDPARVTSIRSGATTYEFDSIDASLGSSLSYFYGQHPRYEAGYQTYGHAISGGIKSVLPIKLVTQIEQSNYFSQKPVTITVIHDVIVDGKETDYFFLRTGRMKADYTSCLFANPCTLEEATTIFLDDIGDTRIIIVMQE